MPDLHDLALDYVMLTLAVGRHHADYVDAYYGPESLRSEAEQGDPRPIAELLERARGLAETARSAPPSPRRDFLERQLIAAETFLRRLGGEDLPLTEEIRRLFDIEPGEHSTDEFVAARARIESLLPGTGELRGRIEAIRSKFVVPTNRLEPVVRAALQTVRTWTARYLELPAGESFEFALVSGRPWGAYNWYQGGLRSRIELNTDVPAEIAPLIGTLSHEGYPGHHTYGVLLEQRLVRERGWLEYTVHPLFSPQSLVAEGTANAGLAVVATSAERWSAIEQDLAPLAGLEGLDFARYGEVLEALRSLRHVRAEAARRLMEGRCDEQGAVDFVAEYGLTTEQRARRSIDFIRRYRSYIFSYTAGEELVERWVGTGPARADRFFEMLQTPTVPSHLALD